MPSSTLIEELAVIAERRLGGNLRLLGLYGSAAGQPEAAHDLDFLLVVDAVESCVPQATQDCWARCPSVQFFVLSAGEFAQLPGFYRFQFAFVKPLRGDFTLPPARREDAIDSITHGFTDSLRTLRQQFKRREWAIADDWARQSWWNLKSFKYALLDACWLLRDERPFDPDRASVILRAAGMDHAAQAVSDWPGLETAANALKHSPLLWIMRWESQIAAAYAEVRPLLRVK